MEAIPLQIAKFRSIINGYKISQIIMTLEKAGVFSAIGNGMGNINDISHTVGVSKKKLSALLDGVVHYDLLTKEGDIYSFSDDSVVLNPKHPSAQNGYIQFSENVRNRWLELGERLKENDGSDALLEVTGANLVETRNFISAMHVNAIPQAKYIAENYDFSNRIILDIGAGSGVYSTAIGERYVDTKGTLFDLPGVCPITKEYVVKSNLANRFSVVAGDYHKGLPDGDFTDIFLFAVIHQESKSNLDNLLKAIRKKVKNGSRLFLTSFFLEEGRTQPTFPVLFSVEMVVMHESGHVYTFKEMEDALTKASFSFERINQIPGPATLFIAS